MFLDTGVMIELMRRPRRDPFVRQLLDTIGDEPLFWSSLQFAELADACRRVSEDIDARVRRVAALVEEVPVDLPVALLASELKAEARHLKPGSPFGLADCVILASARLTHQDLVTLDPDFDCFRDVTVLTAP